MYIARILYPVEVLGPGKRIGIWFDGCPRRCKGCSNPELWEFEEKYHTSFDTVKRMVSEIAKDNVVDGFTLTGGDPLYQYEALRELLTFLTTISGDILVYTGYTKDELSNRDLTGIAVLIDGPYLEERNNGALLRGSDNQIIHILDEDYREKYEAYLRNSKNMIQNFASKNTVISVGIHNKGFYF